MEKLVDEVKKLNLSEKDKLIISMFPGIPFGFMPRNFRQLGQRADCPICLAIAEKIKQINDMKMPSGWRYKLPWVRRAWYQQMNTDASRLFNEARALEDQDKPHWDSGEERKTSKEFVTAYVDREGWVKANESETGPAP